MRRDPTFALRINQAESDAITQLGQFLRRSRSDAVRTILVDFVISRVMDKEANGAETSGKEA